MRRISLACKAASIAIAPFLALGSASAQSPTPYGACRSGEGLNPEIRRLKFNAGASDEFSGRRLDGSRWHDHNPTWVGRDIGKFHPSQVAVAGGRLTLSTSINRIEVGSPAKVLTGTVLSKQTFQYGYFESRSKTANGAVTSSFWFYRDDPDYWTEIDVHENAGMEHLKHEIRSNVHVFRLPKQSNVPHRQSPEVIGVDYDLRDAWTVYGVYWTESHIQFYVNGCLRRTIANDVFHQALNAVFDMEIMLAWLGPPNFSQLPAQYQIDYFRVWR